MKIQTTAGTRFLLTSLVIGSSLACGKGTSVNDSGYVCTSPDTSNSVGDGSVVSCETYPGVKPYCPGMTAKGENGMLTFELVASDPQPPASGPGVEDTFTMEFLDSSGKPVTDAQICITPYMPQMGHGASVTPTATLQSDSTFTISNLNLFMPGVWQISFAVCAAGDTCNASGPIAVCEPPTGGSGSATTLDTGSFWFCEQG
jgi:hypothetical protein